MATPPSNDAFMDLWREFLQQSSGFWSQAAATPKPPEPTDIWKQFLGMWTDFWTQAFSQSPGTFQNAQKLWMEQLDATSAGFENVMGTEAYGTMLSKFFQEQLAWQEKATQAANPQIDGALRSLNLPSRQQIDRLFERIVGIEERLDDLETHTRQIRRHLRNAKDDASAE